MSCLCVQQRVSYINCHAFLFNVCLQSTVHEDLLISGIDDGRDWTSEVDDHKPWPRIRTLDQEPLLFLPESEPGPNQEGQRLHHHTEHNQWTG